MNKIVKKGTIYLSSVEAQGLSRIGQNESETVASAGWPVDGSDPRRSTAVPGWFRLDKP